MKRIAIVVPSLAIGGGVPAVARFLVKAALRSERFAPLLISLSVARGDRCSVRLLDPRSWLRGPRAQSGVWEGLPFTHVGAVGGEFEFQRYRPRKMLSDKLAGVDLIQVVSGTPAWACPVLGLGKPVALQVATLSAVERRRRDSGPLGMVGHWRKAMTSLTERLDEYALRNVDAIQVENPWMLDYASRANRSRTVDLRYAPPGIDAERFKPKETRHVGHGGYILCVGRFDDPRKNVELLLEAYSRLPQGVANPVRLVLAGASPPPQSFWSEVEKKGLGGSVRYIARPSVEQLIDLYREACVFALPSDEEGLGVVVLEAMACAIPVVATRSGGPDGIIQDGLDGYLVPRDDATAMAARLQSLIENRDLNITMGQQARASIERRYDEKVAEGVFVEMWEALTATK